MRMPVNVLQSTRIRDALVLVDTRIRLFAQTDRLSSSLDRFVEIMWDDAFYYFEIAMRIQQGLGFTLDGTAPATGFHVF